ncbi:hypothetical protein RN001_015025 [Aquatica leii]|uniref:Luciferin 4-monooxygenase n=1 Tax=Aquatica leii TaxID=1421715 RepID=A0AAN7P0F3_9COLE|nr:hypothetical protein RN001_015025 [Aquatica leii]
MKKDYKIVDNVIYMPDLEYQPDPRGIGWVYYENMLKNKDLLAQVDGETGEEDTFGALLQRCIRAAIGLRLAGVEYGDVVSVCTYNHLNSCVPAISSMFIGAKIAALDPSLSLPDALHLFKIVMPKLIFVGEESVELIENVIREAQCKTTVVVFGPSEKHIPFSHFGESPVEELEFKPVTVKNIKDVAVIMFSSGTSGLPKGICHTHYSVLRAHPNEMRLGTNASLMFASDSPYWNVFLFYLNYSIQNGTARVLYPRFDRNDTWKVFSRKVTLACLNITELMILCCTPKPESIDTSALRLIITGSSPISVSQISKARALFPNVLIRINFGQSEVFPNILCFDMGDPEEVELLTKKPNSCGLPKTGISYKIIDLETGKALGPNQKGEVRIKTELQLSGYYNMDSKGIWDEDGWLKTGDYGYYDEDYCFYIVDRIKEMFKYQYWHIIPAIIEGIIITHPAVLTAIVIGIPHELDENHAMAIVQLKKGASASEEEIQKYLDEKVEDRQRLRGGVKFVEKFPLTPSGKVNRFVLKQMVLQNTI